ncbi:hypothetical protein OHA84_37620 (plasmid) [Streptomyces sp. NBC_00513]|uniref:hypothetical protein n=1 Tax=unclassified Streptomyces TaxID=2593676 RepID=UPI002250CC25|nr:hypothetical protein [Streptomyces sp. NBC_00424]MCX5078829.1 hypothetical protein [Streptomyces sp. NBC_00424]WUD46251.1 hypothetical protein OHA84_37620 [Streptomyces sp. NBC_00513]
MNEATATGGEVDFELIGRCYTKARRAPLVHGVIRDVNGGRGIRLPGGPYTLTQLAGIVATVGALILTRPVWGGNGWLDVAALLALPAAVAFVLRHLHIDGRNPAAALLSIALMLATPRRGQLRGRAYRPTRPTRGDTRIHLPPDDEPAEATAPTPELRHPRPDRPRPAVPAAEPSAPAAPVASGVQALLARRAPTNRT